MKNIILVKKATLVMWGYFKAVFSEGIVEASKGMLAGGGVGALSQSWDGFIKGMFIGALMGALIGSVLSKLFTLLWERILLFAYVRRIHFDLVLDHIPPEVGERVEGHYLLIRYGRDEDVLAITDSKQDRLVTRLRNSEIPFEKVYDATNRRLVLKCTVKKHIEFGVQFKLYFSGAPFTELKAALERNAMIKEVSSGGGDVDKTYVLLHGTTEVTDPSNEQVYTIDEVKSIEGIPNNFIDPV